MICSSWGPGWGGDLIAAVGPGGPGSLQLLLTLPFALVLLAVEKLADCKLNVAEVTQSEIGQKQKLQTVLEAVQDLLRPHGWALQWTVDCECCWEREPVLSVVHLVTCHRLSLALKRSIHALAL